MSGPRAGCKDGPILAGANSRFPAGPAAPTHCSSRCRPPLTSASGRCMATSKGCICLGEMTAPICANSNEQVCWRARELRGGERRFEDGPDGHFAVSFLLRNAVPYAQAAIVTAGSIASRAYGTLLLAAGITTFAKLFSGDGSSSPGPTSQRRIAQAKPALALAQYLQNLRQRWSLEAEDRLGR